LAEIDHRGQRGREIFSISNSMTIIKTLRSVEDQIYDKITHILKEVEEIEKLEF
jgi:hypothetical protein